MPDAAYLHEHMEALAEQCERPEDTRRGGRAWLSVRRNVRREQGEVPPTLASVERFYVPRVDGHVPIYLREYAATMRKAAEQIGRQAS